MKFKDVLLGRNNAMSRTENRVNRYRVMVTIVLAGLMLAFAAQAQNSNQSGHQEQHLNSFKLIPASDAIGVCLPNASARVTALPEEESRGVDTLDLRAEGLPAHTSFTVFLTELAVFPFGATEYIGEFITNGAGRASLRVDTIVNEAFTSTIDQTSRVRKDLNHVVIWFADPADDDFCVAPGTNVTTPFDGDGQAGTAVLSTRNFLPNAPLP